MAETSGETRFEMTASQLLRINAVIAQLDVSIRQQAFDLLAVAWQPDATRPGAVPPAGASAPAAISATAELALFVQRHQMFVPARDVVMLAAWLHCHLQDELITPRKLQALAALTAVGLPRRPDCTMRYASHATLNLFVRCDGGWAFSTYGREYVGKIYGCAGNSPGGSAQPAPGGVG